MFYRKIVILFLGYVPSQGMETGKVELS